MDVPSNIYAELERLSEELPAPGIWSPPEAYPGYCRPLIEPERLQRVLLESFSEEQLLAAGVLIRSPGQSGPPSIKAALNGPDLRYLFLRRAAAAPPFDIIAADGCLSGRLPAVAVLEDFRIRDLLVKGKASLLLAFSVDDMVGMLGAGFAAATTAGLAGLGKRALCEYCTAFGISYGLRPASGGGPPSPPATTPNSASKDRSPQQPDDSPPAQPIEPQAELGWLGPPCLVAWSPATMTLTCPREHAAILEHFGKLAKHLHVGTADIGSWQPSAAALEQISFVEQWGNPEDLYQAILQSIDRDAFHSPRVSTS